jgi:hypothetical protein
MIDEVDFNDERTSRPAFMFLRAAESGGIAVEVDIVGNGDQIHFTVSLADARRIAERLAEAANDVATGNV